MRVTLKASNEKHMFGKINPFLIQFLVGITLKFRSKRVIFSGHPVFFKLENDKKLLYPDERTFRFFFLELIFAVLIKKSRNP